MSDLKEVDLENVGVGTAFISTVENEVNDNATNANFAPLAQDLSDKSTVQCLLKGDKVFSLSWVNGGGWSAFIGGKWNRKDCKFVTGNVIMNKDWCESKLALQVRWENGNVEKLKQNSTEIAYGDRVFVLDRQCISPGSKVCIIGNPEREGTVTAKRYLATGITTSHKTPDLVFEDIAADKLRRETHGGGFKDNKILYRGWLGITSGYRTRVYLQSQSEDPLFFSIVVDGQISQNFNIGDDIRLGFRILRGAEFLGGETGSSNWLVNFFKFYNTTATVVDCEIDQLLVCWIGEASTPNAPPNQYDLPNVPDDFIPYEELCHVQYLCGEIHNHMTTKSLWVHGWSNEDRPVSKDKWCRKWLDILDWDRWEYARTDDDACHEPKNKYLTLEIMYTRAVIDVLWNNGSMSTVNPGEVLPVQVGSVWCDMMKFHIGSIVKDLMNSPNNEKYGIITSLSDENCATVKWITPCGDYSTLDVDIDPKVAVSTISLYNITEKNEYEFISKVNQCPLASCGKDKKLGVVLGIDPVNQKARVKMIENQHEVEEYYWPHEITHYKCDILLCPTENRWTLWYDHLAPPSGIVRVEPDPDSNDNLWETSSDSLSLTLGLSPPKKVACIKYVPRDNIFVHEDILLRTRETEFHNAIENELAEMEKNLPNGMWVEYYMEREDIFSAIITGPKGSLFEDFIFIFDFFLMENFPKSEPHINFRSMGLTLIPGHLCKSGAVFLPEETGLGEEEFSCSCILNLLLEMKDFMGTPLELIHQNNSYSTIGIKPENAEELYKFTALAVLDYALVLLRHPPKNWFPVIINHFSMALPRIIARYKKNGIQVKRPIATVSNEKGDLPKSEEYEMVTISWNETLLKGVNSRLAELEKILASMQV